MIYNKDFRDIIKNLDKENTLIITDQPYNIGWNYDTYNDRSEERRVGKECRTSGAR